MKFFKDKGIIQNHRKSIANYGTYERKKKHVSDRKVSRIWSGLAIFAGFMKRAIFKLLAAINKAILPRYSRRDLDHLSKLDQALIAYRYWVTKNSL